MCLYRRLFPRKSEVWRPFAEQLGGHYVKGGFWVSDRIEIEHPKNLIRLTAERDVDTNYWLTCFRSPIEVGGNTPIFLMKNWPWQNLFNALGAFDFLASATQQQRTSLTDLQIEGDGFVLSSDADVRLFESTELRAAISRQPRLLLLLGGQHQHPFARKSKGPELALLVPSIITQADQLSGLLELHKLLIDTLFSTGIVQEQ